MPPPAHLEVFAVEPKRGLGRVAARQVRRHVGQPPPHVVQGVVRQRRAQHLAQRAHNLPVVASVAHAGGGNLQALGAGAGDDEHVTGGRAGRGGEGWAGGAARGRPALQLSPAPGHPHTPRSTPPPAPAHLGGLWPALKVDVGGRLLGVGGTRQYHVGTSGAAVAVVALHQPAGQAGRRVRGGAALCAQGGSSTQPRWCGAER